ncbi:MAG: hypothetical protein A2285_08920 [Elusimicrobia bacterium RIFOXYA12_FULL_57_11]|nr:MAG: hypothetical protein A2285_08920 [Elusimicrobia bacterium RIFOXYA12_FULL_57_11]
MRHILFILALAVLTTAAAQLKTGTRLTGLEKRVTKVEKRVTALETGQGATPVLAPGAAAAPADPVAVYFIRKKQFVTRQNIGVTIYLEFENVSRRRFNAFNGILIFKGDDGSVIWSKPYGHSDPLSPGEKVEVAVPVSSVQAREYLKFLKTREISVFFENQEFYSGE